MYFLLKDGEITKANTPPTFKHFFTYPCFENVNVISHIVSKGSMYLLKINVAEYLVPMIYY